MKYSCLPCSGENSAVKNRICRGWSLGSNCFILNRFYSNRELVICCPAGVNMQSIAVIHFLDLLLYYTFRFDLTTVPVCSYKPIVEFIDTQFEVYLQEELKIKRTLHSYHDTRIHACLYFIAPTGHSLKSLDLVTMKKLDSKVSAV